MNSLSLRVSLSLFALAWVSGFLSRPIFDDFASATTANTDPAPVRPTPDRLATEGEAPIDKTCDVINLNGREWGIPFYVLDRAGTQCHKITGAPNGPAVARQTGIDKCSCRVSS